MGAVADCPWCRRARTPVTCSCRGCVDVAPYCDCEEASEDTVAHEGLCPGCREAGCAEGLTAFERCTRLAR